MALNIINSFLPWCESDINNNNRTVGLAYGSWWDSFIGNVLGRSEQMGTYTYTDPAMGCDPSGNAVQLRREQALGVYPGRQARRACRPVGGHVTASATRKRPSPWSNTPP